MNVSNVVAKIESPQAPKPFRLLDLSEELWSKIGKLVVDEERHVSKSYFVEIEILRRSVGRGRRGCRHPNITRACKALRAELLPYFYRTRFDIEVGYDLNAQFENLALPKDWLLSIGPANRALIPPIAMIVNTDMTAQIIKDLLKQTWEVEVEVELAWSCDWRAYYQYTIWFDCVEFSRPGRVKQPLFPEPIWSGAWRKEYAPSLRRLG